MAIYFHSYGFGKGAAGDLPVEPRVWISVLNVVDQTASDEKTLGHDLRTDGEIDAMISAMTAELREAGEEAKRLLAKLRVEARKPR